MFAELKSQNIDVSTPSNEACKMYDATVSQFSSAVEDPSVGGLEGSIDKMLTADPNFVAGIALKLGIAAQFAAKRTYNDPSIAAETKRMMELCEQPHVTQWEKMHAHAINLYVNGQRDMAADVYEDLLVDHPIDMAAIKLVSGMYVENGYYPRLRDCCGRVLPKWKETTPLYGDLLSWYGFGLEETNYFPEAEKMAFKALDYNKNDAWAVHCIAHIREVKGDYIDGANFMENTENGWNTSMYNCHNYWHWALFHYENGDFEASRGLLDTQLLPLMKKYKSPFSITDIASLMFRLEAEGVPVVGWEDCFNVSRDHLDDCAWSYSDVNVMLACAGAKQKAEADQCIKNVKDAISHLAATGAPNHGFLYFAHKYYHVILSGPPASVQIMEQISCAVNAHLISVFVLIDGTKEGDNPRVYKEVTLPVLEAIQAYDSGDYDTAVELLKPIRYDMYKIGGSNAQRDLFNILIIQSALRSKNYQKYASHLIAERQSLKGDTPLMKKMLQKLIIYH